MDILTIFNTHIDIEKGKITSNRKGRIILQKLKGLNLNCALEVTYLNSERLSTERLKDEGYVSK